MNRLLARVAITPPPLPQFKFLKLTCLIFVVKHFKVEQMRNLRPLHGCLAIEIPWVTQLFPLRKLYYD